MRSVPRVAVTLEQCWHEVPGGTAWSALESLRALQRFADIELVGVSARHGSPPPEPWVPPVPVKSLPLPRLALYEAWHWLRRPRVERATGHVDLIHATGMAVPPRTAPLVVTVHDLVFLREPGHSTCRGLMFFRRAIELARRDADLITVPSQATWDDCVENGFDPAKLRLVPWGIAAERVDEAMVDSARQHFGLDKPYVLWVGTIEPRKNLSVLIDAFGLIGDEETELVLVGPRGWNEDLDLLVGATVARDRVRVLGFVTPGELRGLYAGCSVFCMPSSHEGFGLPVLEAMAQGAAVVTSRGTATEEVIGDAGIVVDPTDADAIAHAISRLLTDRVEAERFGRAAASRAATFSWEATAKLLESVYLEAAAL